MKRIDDVDIETNWAEHFPKRLVNGHSKTICTYICLIVSHKSNTKLPNIGARNCAWSYESLVCQRTNFIELKVSSTSRRYSHAKGTEVFCYRFNTPAFGVDRDKI